MTPLALILIVACVMLGVGLLAVIAWFVYTSYLNHVERRLARRKGVYRELVAELATRERALLEPEIHRLGTLLDLEALEAVLEEQARATAARPAWLLDVYDRLGLVDRYVEKLRSARRWRERAFAAELLGRVGNAKAVPALLATVQATRTEDGDVREIALRALARIGDPRAVAPLIDALKTAEVWLAPRIADILTRHGTLVVDPLIAFLEQSSRHPARAWAANVLGEVKAPEALAVLVRSLGDLEDEVRGKAATALGRLGDRRAVTYLLDGLLTDPAPFVRTRIARTLGQFDDPEVVDRLVRALGDPAWWVRMRSVEALEQIGSRAEGPLLVALDDPDPEIRIRAAVGLERLGVPATLVGMIQRGERVPETTETLVKFFSVGAREQLADLLLHSTPEARGAVVAATRRAQRRDLAPELAQAARHDPDPGLRAAAFDVLEALRLPEGLQPALDALGDPDDRVRTAAIRLIGTLGSTDAADRLRGRTADPEPGVRAAAARALGLLRAAGAGPDFLRLLGDTDPEVREAAARGAAAAGIAAAGPGLIELLGDPDGRVRHAAVAGLERLGDPAALPALARAFERGDAPMREAIVAAVSGIDPAALDGVAESRDTAGKLRAVRALRRRRSPAATEVVERFRHDPEPAVRAASIEAIGRLGGDAAGAAIAGGLTDPDDTVRAAAVDAASRRGLHALGRNLIALLQGDPSARVRERAALAVGLLRAPGGEVALLAVCHRPEPPAVLAAAALATGAYEQESIVVRVVEMSDEATVRRHLLERLQHDPAYRLLGRKLSRARHLELRALSAASGGIAPTSLAEGLRRAVDPGDRIRLVGGLRALQGEHSREALLQVVRGDPSPEVRTAALTAVGGLLNADELLAVARRALGDPSLMVRRAAVGLFARIAPGPALSSLLETLRADDDPAVLASVAELAEAAFPTFADLALGMPPDGEEAVLVARVARYVHHPELSRLLPVLARSGSADVRQAIAELWRHRPDVADGATLDALALDPVVGVRKELAGAAAGAARWDLLARLADDPDPDVRREVALALGGASRPGSAVQETLDRLGDDHEMAVRAAAYVGRLLQGRPVPFPPGLDPRAAAGVLAEGAHLPALRETACTAPAEERRLAAALALALLEDDVARQVARTDPVPAVRLRVSGALDLAAQAREGE